MTGSNFNGKYSICRLEMPADAGSLIYTTVRWGYPTEEQAIGDLKTVAESEAIPLADLAVVGTVFALDFIESNPAA